MKQAKVDSELPPYSPLLPPLPAMTWDKGLSHSEHLLPLCGSGVVVAGVVMLMPSS